MSEKNAALPAQPSHVFPAISRTDLIAGLTIFGIALILRLVFVLELFDTPFYLFNQLPGTDMETYIRWAQQIGGGDWIGTEPFWQAPGFPYALGLLFAMSKGSLLFALLVQAFLGAGTALLIYLTMRSLSCRVRTAVFAALLFGLYEASVFFTAIALATTLGAFMGAALLLMMVRAFQTPQPARWLALGAVTGGCCLVRANFMLFIPVIAIAGIALGGPLLGKYFPDWPRGRTAGLNVVFFLLLCGAVIMPVTIRNRAVTGNWTLININGPVTYRLANNYGAPVFNYYDFRARGPLETMPPWSLAWWLHQSRKALGFWIAYEYPQNVSLYLGREYSLGLRLPFLLSFIYLAAPGLAGILLGLGRVKRWLALYIYAGVYYVSIIPFYIISRFRMPLMPALAIFAALGFVIIGELWRSGERRKFIAAAGLYAGCAVFMFSISWLPQVRESMQVMDVISRNNLSGICLANEELDEAVRLLERSLFIFERQPEMLLRLARVRMAQNKPDEAIESLEQTIELMPEAPEPYLLMGHIWQRMKFDPQAAQVWFDKYNRLKSANPTTQIPNNK